MLVRNLVPWYRMMRSNELGGIQAVERALRLLECLSADPSGKRLSQLAEEAELAPSTAHRVLQTLVRAGYVSQDSRDGRYRLTGKLLDVASRIAIGKDLRVQALPHLRRLRDLTGESSHLAVLDGDQALTVESVLSTERNLVDCRVGERAPLHCTAVGKCLIAFLPPDKLEERLSTLELTRFTEHTICTVVGLQENLAEARQKGYATDWDENEIGVRCIAAPVRDAYGEVIAAAGISGPATRITRQGVNELAAHVLDAAWEISRVAGYAEPRGAKRRKVADG